MCGYSIALFFLCNTLYLMEKMFFRTNDIIFDHSFANKWNSRSVKFDVIQNKIHFERRDLVFRGGVHVFWMDFILDSFLQVVSVKKTAFAYSTSVLNNFTGTLYEQWRHLGGRGWLRHLPSSSNFKSAYLCHRYT